MNQRTRLGVFGGIGGVIGSLGSELPVLDFVSETAVLSSAVWFAIVSASIAFFLRCATAKNCAHRIPSARQSVGAILLGGIAGAASGVAAQLLYNQFDDGVFKNYVGRALCWGVGGGLLGILLAFGIPNLRRWRGGVFGFLGGALGGAAFIGVAGFIDLNEELARVTGVGTTGALIGLAIAAADAIELRGRAYIKVVYSAKESVCIALGTSPISFGGSPADTIYVKGMAANSLVISEKSGKVFARQQGAGDIAVDVGSKLRIATYTINVFR